jgi:hypothetical protein
MPSFLHGCGILGPTQLIRYCIDPGRKFSLGVVNGSMKSGGILCLDVVVLLDEIVLVAFQLRL